MQMRFDTWRDSISAVEAHPNGTGLGTVGRATSLTGPTVTTDSSSPNATIGTTATSNVKIRLFTATTVKVRAGRAVHEPA